MNTEQRQQLWDRFLSEWPIERIEALTLAQYVSVEDKSTFTYWLETEARNLGSIKGGSSEKFGIYKRADASKRNGRNNYSHDDSYTWHSKYGQDASTAFARIKQNILDVIKSVKASDLDAIETIDIAPTLKWKVAFIYQNRSKPSVLNIYKAAVLRRAVKNSQATMAQAYSQLLDNKPDDVSLFDYYSDVWTSNQAASDKEIEQLLESMNMDAVNNLSKNKQQQLYELTEWAHDAGLDIYPVNIDNQFRIGRKGLDSVKSDAAFKLVTIQKSKIKLGDANYSLENLATCEEGKDKFAEQYSVDREGYWPVDYTQQNSTDEDTENNDEDSDMTIPSLNQILYGPPGTGKTYHTIEAAVKAAEPEFYRKLNIDDEVGATSEQRSQLQLKFKELSISKRIRFVTFHQSYGYEEFVEGLRAVTNQDKQVEYQVQPGVFKQICQSASSSGTLHSNLLNSNPRIWKLSIDGTKVSQIRTYCIVNNLAAIGWGDTGDMSLEERTEAEQSYLDNLGPQAKSSVLEFTNRMTRGDIVVCVKGQWAIQAVGVVSGDYQYRPNGLLDRPDFRHFMPVSWLATDLDVDLYSLNDNTRLTVKTCYELDRFTHIELFEHLKKNGVDLAESSRTSAAEQNYVLVIDEINRGNISKIFGELITLIEPSKRKSQRERSGEDEAIELILPYSGKPFFVPNNLHIIGTMNTADRSLAMMDTALRRRFEFVEMMPKPSLLSGVIVRGIELEQLLETLNQRIEVLYDREHTLGHAFFMPVKECVDQDDETQAFAVLKSVFQNKIIPLLEEYFFEDWNKIRLVLADNQKAENSQAEGLQFISEEKLTATALGTLFGHNHGLNQYGEEQQKFTLKEKTDSVWDNPSAYIGIYSLGQASGD
ncbi:AAA family ATPase [Vibrio parahaemolyticus]